MGCGDVRLLKTIGSVDFTGQERAALNKLTMPSPVLNDFVHGGRGQLTSNPINESSQPRYPGAWFWSVMLLYTMCVLLTSGWFWAHLGDEKRCRAILDDIRKEDWGTLAMWRNGQEVRVVARGEMIS